MERFAQCAAGTYQDGFNEFGNETVFNPTSCKAKNCGDAEFGTSTTSEDCLCTTASHSSITNTSLVNYCSGNGNFTNDGHGNCYCDCDYLWTGAYCSERRDVCDDNPCVVVGTQQCVNMNTDTYDGSIDDEYIGHSIGTTIVSVNLIMSMAMRKCENSRLCNASDIECNNGTVTGRISQGCSCNCPTDYPASKSSDCSVPRDCSDALDCSNNGVAYGSFGSCTYDCNGKYDGNSCDQCIDGYTGAGCGFCASGYKSTYIDGYTLPFCLKTCSTHTCPSATLQSHHLVISYVLVIIINQSALVRVQVPSHDDTACCDQLTDEEIFNALPVTNNKRTVPSTNAWWQSHVAKYSAKSGTEFEQHRAYTLYNFTKDGIAHEVPCADVIDASECTVATLILPAINYVTRTIDLSPHQNKIIYMPMLRLDGERTTYEVILPDNTIIKVDIDLDTASQKEFKIHGHNSYTFHSGNTVSINHKYKLKFGSLTVHSYRHHLLARVNLHVSDLVRSRRQREPKLDFTATAHDPDSIVVPDAPVLRSEVTEEESEHSRVWDWFSRAIFWAS